MRSDGGRNNERDTGLALTRRALARQSQHIARHSRAKRLLSGSPGRFAAVLRFLQRDDLDLATVMIEATLIADVSEPA